MNQRLTASARVQHLHALERAADEQREQLRLHAVELVGGVRQSVLGQKISQGIEQGRGLARMFASLSNLGRSQPAATAGHSGDKRAPFPWLTAVSTACGLHALFRWWRQNRSRQ